MVPLQYLLFRLHGCYANVILTLKGSTKENFAKLKQTSTSSWVCYCNDVHQTVSVDIRTWLAKKRFVFKGFFFFVIST